MKSCLHAVSLVIVFVVGILVSRADTNPPPVTVFPFPATWALFGDGPIDGVPDFLEVNGRFVAGYSTTSPEVFNGVYEFSLGNLKTAAQSSVLKLQAYFINTDEGVSRTVPFQLFGYTGDGRITGADFSAGTLLSSFSLSAVGTYNIDVSSFVSTAFLNGAQFVGFNLRPNGNPITDRAAYYFGTPTQGPVSSTLVVTAVPEPQVATLVLLGMLVKLNPRPRTGSIARA